MEHPRTIPLRSVFHVLPASPRKSKNIAIHMKTQQDSDRDGARPPGKGEDGGLLISFPRDDFRTGPSACHVSRKFAAPESNAQRKAASCPRGSLSPVAADGG